MNMNFIAVIHKERKSDYGVSFPDFPGCISAGKTLDSAFEMASEALQFHIDGMIQENIEIPRPTSLEEIRKCREYRGAEAFLMVQGTIPDTKAKRVNITMPRFILSKIDSFARRHGDTRSALISKAAMSYIQEKHARQA